MSDPITGREPRLSPSHSQHGGRRLSLRGVATMLNALPPEAISLDAAESALRSDAFFTRYAAAKVLSRRGDRDARIVLERVLSDGSAPSRASVARHLGGFSWMSIQPLIEKALADPDERVREAVVYALCDMDDGFAYQRLAQAVEGDSYNLKLAAAWALRECQDPAAVPTLAAALACDDPEVRVQALESLGFNGSVQSVPITQAALDDSDPEVKYAAVLSLLELVGEAALPPITEMLKHTTGANRESTLKGIFHGTNYLGIDLTAPQIAPLILNACDQSLKDDHSSTRLAAVWLLSWVRVPESETLYTQAYRTEPDPDTQAQMLRIIVSLMTSAGERLLEEASQSPVMAVHEMAKAILTLRDGRIAHWDESDTSRHGLSTPKLDGSEF